jgi:hypothetical protein
LLVYFLHAPRGVISNLAVKIKAENLRTGTFSENLPECEASGEKSRD